MRKQFEEIYKAITDLGIRGSFIFTGSAVLKAYNLLDREIKDIDLILDTNDWDKIKALNSLFASKDYSSYSNEHYLLDLPSLNTKLDIFKFHGTVECYEIENQGFFVAAPKYILNQKKEMNREKDKEDIENVMFNLADIVIDEKKKINSVL